MSYKCLVCGMTDVANAGDVCPFCADPYAQSAPSASNFADNTVSTQTCETIDIADIRLTSWETGSSSGGYTGK